MNKFFQDIGKMQTKITYGRQGSPLSQPEPEENELVQKLSKI